MRTTFNRLVSLALLGGAFALIAAPAASARYVSGHQVNFNEQTLTAKMTGDLLGTWKITKFSVKKHTPYLFATGTERFTGCLDRGHDHSCAGDPTGTLRLTFRYWAQMKRGAVQLGTCSHRIVGAGGGLAGATGFVMMVDTPKRTGKGVTTQYEGNVQLPLSGASGATVAAAGSAAPDAC